MTIHVSVGDATARLAELLEKAEAGEDVVIARGGEPVVRLVRMPPVHDREKAERAIAAIREWRVNLAPTTPEEIREWRDEGRRF